jgi:hypothetical protein
MGELARLQRLFSEELKKREGTSLEVGRHVGIYRHAIATRFEESLAEDYPLCREELGERAFASAVAEYMRRHPSRFQNLSMVSLDFPEFLAAWTSHAFLPQLARFEKAKLLSSQAGENPPRLSLDNISHENPRDVRLVFDTSFELFSSSWTVHQKPVVLRPTRLMIFDGECQEVDETLFVVLQALKNGESLLQAAGASDESEGDNPRAEDFNRAFSLLAREEIVIGYQRIQ